MDNNQTQDFFYLDSPEKCVLLVSEDWHVMDEFSETSILLVMANTEYEKEDYIFEPYGRVVNIEI